MRLAIVLFAVVALGGCFEPPDPPDHPVGWLQTSGNGFLLDGEPWAGRGANFHDTRYCGSCAFRDADDDLLEETQARADLLIDTWGVDFVRLNLESHVEEPGKNAVHWEGILDDEAYLEDLMALVAHIGTHEGVFVEVVPTIEATTDDRGWPTDATVEVVELLAEAFVDAPHVLFGLGHQLTSDGEDEALWEQLNTMAEAIRAVEDHHGTPHHVIVAPGTDRSSSLLDHYLDHPLEAGDGTDIAYEVHVIDGPDLYAERVFDPAETLPVLIGFLGPDPHGAAGTSTADDNAILMSLAHGAGIPYAAWTFHWDCGDPNLLHDDIGNSCGMGAELTPSSEWGEVFYAAHHP